MLKGKIGCSEGLEIEIVGVAMGTDVVVGVVGVGIVWVVEEFDN